MLWLIQSVTTQTETPDRHFLNIENYFMTSDAGCHTLHNVMSLYCWRLSYKTDRCMCLCICVRAGVCEGCASLNQCGVFRKEFFQKQDVNQGCQGEQRNSQSVAKAAPHHRRLSINWKLNSQRPARRETVTHLDQFIHCRFNKSYNLFWALKRFHSADESACSIPLTNTKDSLKACVHLVCLC